MRKRLLPQLVFFFLMIVALCEGKEARMESSEKLLERLLSSPYRTEIRCAIQAALSASEEILRVKQSLDLQIVNKDDHTPITRADTNANRLIGLALHSAFPLDGLLSEELFDQPELQAPSQEWLSRRRFWVIDPLDGTKNFCTGGSDYGIHIALVDKGIPVVGVNYYPETATLYFAVKGYGAFKKIGREAVESLKLSVKKKCFSFVKPAAKEIEILLKNHFSTLPFAFNKTLFQSCGLRICSVAEGTNDLFLSDGKRGGIWDFCSGAVIVTEAGGIVSDWQGRPLSYDSRKFAEESGIVIASCQSVHAEILGILRLLVTD